MPITDWHRPYNTIDDFRTEFSDKTDEYLFTVAETWKGQTPGITAKLMLEERKKLHQEVSDRKQWWTRPLGILAIGIITNILTAAVFYLLGRSN
jgi:hypothetical protein